MNIKPIEEINFEEIEPFIIEEEQWSLGLSESGMLYRIYLFGGIKSDEKIIISKLGHIEVFISSMSLLITSNPDFLKKSAYYELKQNFNKIKQNKEFGFFDNGSYYSKPITHLALISKDEFYNRRKDNL